MYIGLDIGGTKIIAAAGGIGGNIYSQIERPTPPELGAGIDLLHKMVEEVSGGAEILGIGATIGGPMDWRTGVVSPLHQPSWRKVPLKTIMEERWRVPFWVDVDTNAAALGEYSISMSKPERLLYITISTGMGGGFVVDGEIYRGAGGEHPEIAHQVIPHRCRYPERVICECGLPDCLEGLISGNAIRRIYSKPAEELYPDEWDEVAYHLGLGLRNLVTILAPNVIALGGGVAIGGGKRLVHQAGDIMRQGLRLVHAPELRLSHLGYYTAVAGAVYLAIHGHKEN